MAGTSSGIVAGLAAAALGTVGFLALQAQATVPASLRGDPAASASAAAARKAPRDRHNPTALPANSGTGERVVYSVDDDRVWLVAPGDRVRHTYEVRPGTVDPPPGIYWVTSRSNMATGTDGLPVEHVVRFTSVNEVVIGFSAVVNSGSGTMADPSVKTGGIRESRTDGDAMWQFATIGVPVVVIR
ncbi:hypothetical protein JK361_13795 [Streptomyces sp. 5-8]|uniref:L,D-transpeptidase n=1 Tax=Streptomyces musisoli TaxID=2802280 RepID=A0ABS1NZV0_9ACTN|nr:MULTISPECIES: hypothetical protein [Streptomyces]MBL1105646.1 hypothetical protein [Streptomyces musisoli]MBY8845184.1 hypothetical protein [Streptomyces sp. SP2-10]